MPSVGFGSTRSRWSLGSGGRRPQRLASCKTLARVRAPHAVTQNCGRALGSLRGVYRGGSAFNLCIAAFMARTNHSVSPAASAHWRHVMKWSSKRSVSAGASRSMMYASATSSISVGHASGELEALGILKVVSAAPGLFAFRTRRYSILSFAFAAAAVCHCILPGASAPPRLSGTT